MIVDLLQTYDKLNVLNKDFTTLKSVQGGLKSYNDLRNISIRVDKTAYTEKTNYIRLTEENPNLINEWKTFFSKLSGSGNPVGTITKINDYSFKMSQEIALYSYYHTVLSFTLPSVYDNITCRVASLVNNKSVDYTAPLVIGVSNDYTGNTKNSKKYYLKSKSTISDIIYNIPNGYKYLSFEYISTTNQEFDININDIFIGTTLKFNGLIYKIDNVTFENNTCVLDCTIDLLSSYQDEIKKLTVLIDKSSSNYNQFYPDNIPIISQKRVQIRRFKQTLAHNNYGYLVTL